MKLRTKLAVLAGSLTLAIAPAAALASGQPADPGSQGKGPHYTPETPKSSNSETPGPKASLPEKAKAYGVYCKDQSRKHVKGEKGTPFSRCVVGAAQLQKEQREREREEEAAA